MLVVEAANLRLRGLKSVHGEHLIDSLHAPVLPHVILLPDASPVMLLAASPKAVNECRAFACLDRHDFCGDATSWVKSFISQINR